MSSYLPTQVANVFSQGRAFTSVALPEAGVRRICAIATIQKTLRFVLLFRFFLNLYWNTFRLLVASQDGYLYVYSIPSIEGGECQLIKKHDLRNSDNFSVDVKGECEILKCFELNDKF